MEAVATRLVRHPGDERSKRLRHMIGHGGESFVAHVHAAERLGQRHHAEPQRFPRLDPVRRLRRARIEAKPYDLRGSAADIEHHRRAGFLVGEIADAGRGEMRLSLAIDNFELDAEPFANLGDKVRPIGGRTAGFGRDGAGASDATRRHLVPADLQGLKRARDRRLAQASGQRQPLA